MGVVMKRMQLPAESYNPNTGLEYLRARYYNADKGRFFQEDTYLGDITDPLTLNRYAYVKNSPLNYADPSGHVAEYLTGPQYNPDDGWQANHYPLSQTGPEKTEFPIEIVSGTEAVKQFWGSVSEGLDHVMSQLKEAADLSLSQLRELRGWMKEAVSHSVVNVCENRVDLGAEIGETLLALISGALMGIDNAFNVPTDAMDEFFSSHALAYNIGKILGKSGTIAILSLLAGLFLGGGAAAAGGATLALGGAMVVVSSSVIAIEWSALTAGSLSLSVSDHSSGSGEVEEGESEKELQAGDKTPKGREYTKHGAERANERGFDSQKIDSIIDNNYKHRTKEIDKLTGKITWRYQDKRGNTVITNEWGDKIVTVYSHPTSVNGGNYIPKK